MPSTNRCWVRGQETKDGTSRPAATVRARPDPRARPPRRRSTRTKGRLAHFGNRLIVVRFIRLRLDGDLGTAEGGGGAQVSVDLLAFTAVGIGEQPLIGAQFVLLDLDARADGVGLTGGAAACILPHSLDGAPDRAFC